MKRVLVEGKPSTIGLFGESSINLMANHSLSTWAIRLMEVDTKTSYIALALALALFSEETPGLRVP